MKSGLWMFCVVFFMFIIAPMFIVLTYVGATGAGFGTILMYWIPIAFCAVIATALVFHRQSIQRGRA